MAATLTSFVVQGPTDLDPSTTADAGLGVGIDGNGWVVFAVLPHIVSSLNFDPSKVVLTVQDPGYDASGTTTVTRIIRGGKNLRRQRPNATTKQAAINGSNLEVYFSLEDDIFAGSTITAVACEAGYYDTAPAGDVACTLDKTAVTRAYEKPKWGWLQAPYLLVGAGGLYVEAIATSCYGRNGQQVPRVEFYGTDGANTTPAQICTTPILSTLNRSPYVKTECYAANIPVSGLNVGAGEVYAKVYPWIGDSSAVLDLSVTFAAMPTSLPQIKLPFYNDKNGTYGGATACVKVGAVGGTVYHNDIISARAAPFPTALAALTAISTFNGATTGRPAGAITHSDTGGAAIYLMDDGAGGAVDHTQTANITTTSGAALHTITPDPANTAAVTYGPTGANRGLPHLTRFKDLTIKQTASVGFDGLSNTGNRVVVWDNVALQIAGSTRINYRLGHNWWINCTLTGMTDPNAGPFFNVTTAARSQNALIFGCVDISAGTNPRVQAALLIANVLKRYYIDEYGTSFTNHEATHNQRIYACNRIQDIRLNASQIGNQGSNLTSIDGFHFIQNVLEVTVNTTSPGIQITADSSNCTMQDYYMAYSIIPGSSDSSGRANRIYADTAVDKTKEGRERFNIFGGTCNCKTDTYIVDSTITGRIGNWRFRYGVACLGNVSLWSDVSNTQQPSNNGAANNLLAEHWPKPSNSYATTNVGFVDDQGGTNGGNAGGTMGDYRLTGTGDAANAAYNMVPAGMAALRYDILGNPRRNDGRGAAGPYERTDIVDTGGDGAVSTGGAQGLVSIGAMMGR